MSPIQNLKLTCAFPNKEETFSEGDTVAGTVTFTLTKQTKLKSILLKVKGDARVEWTEGSGDDETSYSARRRYFKVKDSLVAEGTELPKGVHHFKFRLKIPEGDMPSSFKGSHGKIVYTLEAKISRSWRWPSRVQAELNFVSKSLLHHDQVKRPCTGSVDKNVGVFSKGLVQMTVTVDRKVCSPGDTLSVVAKICNLSSKKMKPKFSLQQRTIYRAGGSTKTCDQSQCKIVCDTIKGNSEETVSCQMKIPVDAIHSLRNCDIISVDYYLKVYLDISFAFDPEVRFPLVIAPLRFASLQPGEEVGPYPYGGPFGAPSYSDFPAPAFPTASYPVFGGPGPYGYPPLDPTQHANSASGYNNQWQQQVPPYGLSNAAFPPPAPTAPPLVQQEPPTYTTLFPNRTYGGTGPDQKKN